MRRSIDKTLYEITILYKLSWPNAVYNDIIHKKMDFIFIQ